MEKYLIILVLAFVAYYSLKCFNQTKEGFADAQTIDGVDESNSINTLAKIAKDIMDGGSFKVSGNITTEGDFSHIGPSKKNKVSLHTPADGRRALYISPQKLDGTGWEWENGLTLDFKEKTFSTNSNNLVVGGGTISAPARLHISGGELLYLLNKSGVIIGKELGGSGNLAVQGDLSVQGNITVGANKPLVYTKVVTGGLARDIDTGVSHNEYPAISMAGFATTLDLEERDGGGFEFNTFKRDGRWWIYFNPRAQGNWHGGDNRVRARLTFFHSNIAQDDSKNLGGL